MAQLMRQLVWGFFLLMGVASGGCNSGDDAALLAPTGTLLMIDNSRAPQQQIVQMDVATGEKTTLFSNPEFSQVYQLEVAGNGRSALLAYTPPPSGGAGFFDRSGLYVLPLDQPDAELQSLLGGEVPQEYYYQPVLSKDGRFLFYMKLTPDYDAGVSQFNVTLERVELANGATQLIAPDGIWPRLSPDGSRLAYIAVDPITQQRGLMAANADGTQQIELIPKGTYFDIDSPLFSSDGRTIFFTVAQQAAARSWFDDVMGVQTAFAHTDHNIPSDWWRIPAAGGTPEQLTELNEIIFYGDIDPQGDYLAFSTSTGVYVMSLDTFEPIKLNDDRVGIVKWLPHK